MLKASAIPCPSPMIDDRDRDLQRFTVAALAVD